MPILGQGVVPSGAVASELTYVTRRAFIDQMVVQIYNCSPLWASLLANAQMATGGVSSVTVPINGAAFTQSQWIGYDGSFNQPAYQQGVTNNAEFDLKALITPIIFNGMEGLLQMNHAVVPLIQARMADATDNASDAFSTAAYSNTANTQQLIGLPGAIDDGTNLVTYAGINRTNYPFWQSKVYNNGSAPTRKNVSQYIAGTQKNGAEVPHFGVMGWGTWANLEQDFIGAESYYHRPGDAGFEEDAGGTKSGFRALVVGGVPIYGDPYCPEGVMYLINTNYLNLYVHEMASFAFSGFESLLTNFQLGYLAVVLTLAELVNTKPKTCTRVFNYTSLTI